MQYYCPEFLFSEAIDIIDLEDVIGSKNYSFILTS